MFKKLITVLLSLTICFSFCSCSFNSTKKQTSSYSFTQKVTVIHNHYKDKLPDFDFKSEPVEKYRDGYSYTLSVTCKLKEFDKYVNKLKKAGFVENVLEAETFFSANTQDGYFVEVTYVGDMLTVFVKNL